MVAGTVSAAFVDCHIYENQIEQVKEQIEREPYNLPTAEITGEWNGIFNWSYKDVKWHDYKHHPKLTAEVVV